MNPSFISLGQDALLHLPVFTLWKPSLPILANWTSENLEQKQGAAQEIPPPAKLQQTIYLAMATNSLQRLALRTAHDIREVKQIVTYFWLVPTAMLAAQAAPASAEAHGTAIITRGRGHNLGPPRIHVAVAFLTALVKATQEIMEREGPEQDMGWAANCIWERLKAVEPKFGQAVCFEAIAAFRVQHETGARARVAFVIEQRLQSRVTLGKTVANEETLAALDGFRPDHFGMAVGAPALAGEVAGLFAELQAADPGVDVLDYWVDGAWDVDGLRDDVEVWRSGPPGAAGGEAPAGAPGAEAAELLAQLAAAGGDADPEHYQVDGVWDLDGLRDDARLLRERGREVRVGLVGVPEPAGEAAELIAEIAASGTSVDPGDYWLEEGDWDLDGLREDARLAREGAEQDFHWPLSRAAPPEPGAEVASLLVEAGAADAADYWVDGQWDMEGLREDARLQQERLAGAAAELGLALASEWLPGVVRSLGSTGILVDVTAPSGQGPPVAGLVPAEPTPAAAPPLAVGQRVHVRVLAGPAADATGAAAPLALSMRGGDAEMLADVKAQLRAWQQELRGPAAPAPAVVAPPGVQDCSAFAAVPSQQILPAVVHHAASFGVYVTVSPPEAGHGPPALGLAHLTELGGVDVGSLQPGRPVDVQVTAVDVSLGRLAVSIVQAA
ncbi:unnamed protein product [Prorocentrum cordatum]|uniref:S1 motif domain-containing protein n=1 Tax=Prorocentrum cordatum TaxID=2364126 RepID=A0ABN9SYL3_9DINO|nr:unnamed protein product [Polarella glacialis]